MREPKEIFRNLIQVGLIVEDLDTALSNLEEIIGMGPFRIAEYPPKDEPNCERTYYESDGNYKGKFCFFHYGNIEFEVIQPVEGDNIWFDYLKENKGSGLHHLKFLVDDHQEVKEFFESKGVHRIQSGASVGINKGKSWAYYDTKEKFGFYIEVMNDLKKV